MSQSLRRAVGSIGRWPRLLAVATCLLLALASALNRSSQAAAPPAATSAVVVAARALPAGHVVARSDLVVVRWPDRLVPAAAFPDPAGLLGARLAGPVGEREAVTRTRLVGSALSAGLGTGTVATTLTLDTDVGAFIRSGDHVDLLAAARTDAIGDVVPARAVVLAEHLPVLAVYPVAGDGAGPATSALVLATTRDQALQIAGLRTTRVFTAVGDPP